MRHAKAAVSMMFFLLNVTLTSHQNIMNTSLAVYALGGAIIFAALSVVSTKFREESLKPIHIVRDTAAGGILTAVLLALIPEMFPAVDLSSMLSNTQTAVSATIPKSLRFDEYDLQVGYPKRK